MIFPLGWIRGLDETNELHEASKAHIGAALDRFGTLPDDDRLTRDPWVTNQNGESCTIEGAASMIYGLTGKKTDTWVGWWGARKLDAPSSPLRNVGVSMQSAVDAMGMAGFGCCPLRIAEQVPEYAGGRYPIEQREKDGRPAIEDTDPVPPSLMRDAAQTCNLDVVQLFGRYGYLAGIVDAIHQQLPPCIAIRADAGYQHPEIRNGEAFVGPESGPGGLHLIRLWGYRMRPDGIWFLNPSSWDFSHGVNGLLWIHQSRIENAYAALFARAVS